MKQQEDSKNDLVQKLNEMDRLLTLDDFCKIFQFKKQTAYNLIYRKALPVDYFKVGKSIRIEPKKLADYIEKSSS